MACITPYYVEVEKPNWNPISQEWDSSIPVKCGKCPQCIDQKIGQWAFRLQWEAKRSVSAHFVTLTYDQKNIPHYATDEGELVLHLQKEDVQNFYKRLRQHDIRRKTPTIQETLINSRLGRKMLKHDERLERPKIKHYTVGEFGRGGRPHYHAIVFNTFPAHIEKAWSKGIIDIQKAEMGAIKYTLKYLHKEGDARFSQHDDKRNIKPFSLSSKHLGRNYLFNEDGSISDLYKWHRTDILRRQYVTLRGGYKVEKEQEL